MRALFKLTTPAFNSSPLPTFRYNKQMNTGYKHLLAISIPAIISVAMEPLAGLIDTALVGQQSSEWLAALAITATIFTTVTSVFNFLVYTVTARIAGASGQSKQVATGEQIKLALITATILGVATAGALSLLDHFFLRTLMGASVEMYDLALPYFHIRVFSLPFVLISTALIGILRGLHCINFSLVQIGITTAVNATVSYLLIFKFNMGLVGAGIGTALGFISGCVFSGVILFRRRLDIGLTNFSLPPLSEMLDFGKEASQLFMRTLTLLSMFFVATSIASRISVKTVAAHTIAMQIWMFGSFLLDGFAVTATAYGGKLIGLKDLVTWKILNKKLLILGIGAGCLLAVVFYFLELSLYSIFTNDPALIAILSSYFAIIIAAQPINGILFVYDGILFGSRDYKFLKKSTLVAVVACAVPTFYLAYTLQNPSYILLGLLGVNGVRAIMAFRFLNLKTAPVKLPM